MWTIEETNEKKPAGSNFSSIIGGVGHSSSVVGKWTDDEINEFIEKASKLEEEKMSLEANLDQVMNAKQSLEKLLTAERKTTKELKARIEQAEAEAGGAAGGG